MAVIVSERENARVRALAATNLRWYGICGLPVQSEVQLRLPELTPPGDDEPAWVIRVGATDQRAPMEPPAQPDPSRGPAYIRGTAFTTYLDAGGSWWWFDTVATVHVSTDARLVDVYPKSGADEHSLGLALTGPLTAFVMYRLGYPTLHSSAVATPHGAAAFLGGSGYGKSTLAAAFVKGQGMPLLADDLMPLALREDGVYVRPSLPVMKLWPSTAEKALGLRAHDLPNVSAYWDKKFLLLDGDAALAREPVRLAAVYVLDRYEPVPGGDNQVTIRGLSAREGMTAILAQMPCGSFLQPREATRFLPLFAKLVRQAPVRVLKYPADFARLDTTCARILEDLLETR